MKGRDILVMSLQNWGDALGSNSYNLAMEFAKQNKVLYVNRAPDRISQCKLLFNPKKINKDAEWISNPFTNLYVLNTQTVMESINWLPTKPFQYLNYYNGKKLSKEIKQAILKLGMKNLVLFIDNDFIRGLYLKELINPTNFIYYIRDNLITHKYFSKHGKICEEQIATKADLIVANSPYLANLLKPFNDNIHDIGQGCDFSLFQEGEAEKPDDFPESKNPTIGYVGNIVSYRLDIKLLESICKRRKDWNWVFVGPLDEIFKKSPLTEYSNVYFLGPKSEKEIWKYIYHIDVCINPQLINGMTEGNYPRKIDEYLCMGKPVVATRTDFMESFSNIVYLYNNSNEFEEKLVCALSEKKDAILQEKRKKVTKNNTWDNCVNKIYKHIRNESF